MAAFKFRLAKVLKVREIREEQSKFKWAQEERLAHEERARLARLRDTEQEIKNFGYGQGEITLRLAMYEYLEALGRRIEHQEERVAVQEKAADREGSMVRSQEGKEEGHHFA